MKSGTTSSTAISINPQWNEILQKIKDIEQGRASLDSFVNTLDPNMLWIRKTKTSGIEDSVKFLLASHYPGIFKKVWDRLHNYISIADLLTPTTTGVCLLEVLMTSSNPSLKPIISQIFEKYPEAKHLGKSLEMDVMYKEFAELYNTSTSEPNDEYEKLILSAIESQNGIDHRTFGLWNLIAKAARFSKDQNFYYIWKEIKDDITIYELRKSSNGISILWLLALLATRNHPQIFNEVWHKHHLQFTEADLLNSVGPNSVLMLLMKGAQTYHMLRPIIIEILYRFPKSKHISSEIMYPYQHMDPALKSAYYKQLNLVEQKETIIPEKQLVANEKKKFIYNKIVRKLSDINLGTIPAASILDDLNSSTIQMVPGSELSIWWHLLKVFYAVNSRQRNEFEPVFNEIWEKYGSYLTLDDLRSTNLASNHSVLWMIANMAMAANPGILLEILDAIWLKFHNNLSLDDLRCCPENEPGKPDKSVLWSLAFLAAQKGNHQYFNAVLRKFSDHFTIDDFRSKNTTGGNKGTSIFGLVVFMLPQVNYFNEVWQKFHDQITAEDLLSPIGLNHHLIGVLLQRAQIIYLPSLNDIIEEIFERFPDILSDAKNVAENSKDIPEVHFGIHGRLPEPPKPVSNSLATLPAYYKQLNLVEQKEPIIPEKQLVANEKKKFIYNKIVRKLSDINLGTIPAASILDDLNSSTIQMVPGSELSIWWHLLIVFRAVDSRQRRDFEPVFNEIWEQYGPYLTLDDLRSKNLANNRSVLWMIATMANAKEPGILLEILHAIWLKFHNNLSLDDLRCCPENESGKRDKSVLWSLAYLAAQKGNHQYFSAVWQKFSDHFIIDDFRSKATIGVNVGTSIFGLLVSMLPQVNYFNKVWQKFYDQITAEDLLSRIGDSTLIETLLQHSRSLHQPLLTRIIEEIFERFPDILSDTRIKNKSLGSEQSGVYDLTNSIYQPEQHSPNVGLCFGIDEKNIHGRLPVPPMPVSTSLATLPLHTYKHTFETLNKCPSKDFVPKRIVFGSKSASFTGDLYSCTPLNDKESITFICARRTINALIPQITTKNRCVLVLTAEEFESLKPILPNNLDALVVKSLQSDTHGAYTSLGMITCRRLAIFLCAFNLEVDNFLMLDDNIEHLHFSDVTVNYNDWKSAYTLLLNNLQDYGCISVKTLSPKIAKEGLLGSKMFMINMKEIKKHLCNEQDMYMFFPNAAQASKWGEDYYMQIMMHALLKPHGCKVLEQNTICLERSRKNRNVFAKTGARASVFEEFNQTTLQQIPATHRELLDHTLYTINQLINENLIRYKNKEKYLKRVNLLKAHAKANGLKISPFSGSISLSHEDIPFANRFKMAIKETALTEKHFYYYQQDAIKNVADLEDNMGRYEIGTGCGKTRIQCALASIGYHVANDNEHIVIVTPNIQLMKQFYRDFIDYNKAISTQPVPEEAIITVSSNQQSCNIEALMRNDKIKNQKAIMIFCVNSLMNLLNSNSAFFQNTPLMFTDEYHEYESRMITIRSAHFRFKDRILIGCSATPPENDIFKKTIYSFSRTRGVKEKFLAPVIADCLGANYSEENVKNLITALPRIIAKRYHPGFLDAKTLSSTKGIVYLPSIEHCEQAKFKLERYGFRVFCIHSKNKTHKQQLDAFMKDERPGVVLAFQMLKVGFDLPELAWAIIGQKADENDYKSRRK